MSVFLITFVDFNSNWNKKQCSLHPWRFQKINKMFLISCLKENVNFEAFSTIPRANTNSRRNVYTRLVLSKLVFFLRSKFLEMLFKNIILMLECQQYTKEYTACITKDNYTHCADYTQLHAFSSAQNHVLWSSESECSTHQKLQACSYNLGCTVDKH